MAADAGLPEADLRIDADAGQQLFARRHGRLKLALVVFDAAAVRPENARVTPPARARILFEDEALEGERRPPARARSALRRIAAFVLDQLVVGLWIGGISLAAWAGRAADWLPEVAPPAEIDGKMVGHSLSFLVLTLPVLLYFALLEARRGATVGKHALGLRVAAAGGGGLTLGRALLRNAIKLAPWELSHVAIWYMPGRPFVDPPAAWSLAAWSLALAAAAVWVVSLFVGDGRTPYDRIAGSRVRRAPRAAQAG
jgi:uncharacterized RDD family membrane protein YckC